MWTLNCYFSNFQFLEICNVYGTCRFNYTYKHMVSLCVVFMYSVTLTYQHVTTRLLPLGKYSIEYYKYKLLSHAQLLRIYKPHNQCMLMLRAMYVLDFTGETPHLCKQPALQSSHVKHTTHCHRCHPQMHAMSI